MKTAIILGSNGQDGRILSEQLRTQGYKVTGVDHGHEVDICNVSQMSTFIKTVQPNEIYHLAAFHHSSEETLSEDEEFYQKSFQVNYFSLLNTLEGMRQHAPQTKLFYAGSSHIFGSHNTEMQNENTALNPDSVYAITKAAALQTCRIYRQKYNTFATYGILYTHDSQYRSEKFLSQKIIRTAFRIKGGSNEKLHIGDLSAEVDWGYASEYMQAAHRTLQINEPHDFIIATGKKIQIADFVNTVFKELGLDWREHVIETPELLKRKGLSRIGNPEKLKKFTGAHPKIYGAELAKTLLKLAN